MEPPTAKEPEQGLRYVLANVFLGSLGVFPFLFGSMSQNLFVCEQYLHMGGTRDYAWC